MAGISGVKKTLFGLAATGMILAACASPSPPPTPTNFSTPTPVVQVLPSPLSSSTPTPPPTNTWTPAPATDLPQTVVTQADFDALHSSAREKDICQRMTVRINPGTTVSELRRWTNGCYDGLSRQPEVMIAADLLYQSGSWKPGYPVNPNLIPAGTEAALYLQPGIGGPNANFDIVGTPTPFLPVATNTLTPLPATNTPLPPNTSTATPSPSLTVDRIINIRTGPGTVYDIVGQTKAGETYSPVGRNRDGSWFRLSDGRWIANIRGVSCSNCDGLPVVEAPPTPTRAPSKSDRWATINLPDGSTQDQANYVLSLLEQNGYGNLVGQLRALPEIATADPGTYVEPLADIAALALTATDPEVREAYDLMVRGGMGNSLVSYAPNWNTQLQVLFWIANDREFKVNDNLVQAIAMSNGLWVAMGDDAVDQAVRNDVTRFLDFQRKYNPQVEDYPLEALAALSWTGNITMRWDGEVAQPNRLLRLVYYRNTHLPLEVYQRDTVSVETLNQMRQIAVKNGWVTESIPQTVKLIEDFFYFGGYNRNWDFTTWPNLPKDENGIVTTLDADWQFQRYLKKGRPIGDCITETIFVNEWLRSLGIPTLPQWMYRLVDQGRSATDWYSHHYPIFFNPQNGRWFGNDQHYKYKLPSVDQYFWDFFIYFPPTLLNGYLRTVESGKAWPIYDVGSSVVLNGSLSSFKQKTINDGIPSSQIKNWMFYRN